MKNIPAFFAALRADHGGQIFLAILAVVAVVVPLLNLMVPESNPLHLSTYTVTLLGKYLCFALLALAMDLVWGYCGILSLGHGAFFSFDRAVRMAGRPTEKNGPSIRPMVRRLAGKPRRTVTNRGGN